MPPAQTLQGNAMTAPADPQAAAARARARAAAVRTALVLASIAAVFFFGIIASHWIGGDTVRIGVVGGAVLLFLLFGIGRHLRK